MTLTQLRYFLALSERLHFNQTAELLYISQPSLTQHISKLEKELGVPLFNRNSDGLSLTPAGVVMQREVKTILDKLDVLVHSIKDPAAFNSVPAVFKILIDDYTFTHEEGLSEAFVATIKGLNKSCPMAELRTEPIAAGKGYRRRLHDGTADLCLGMLEEPGDVNLACVHFSSQRQYLAIPGECRLERRGNQKRIAEYLYQHELFMADYDHRMEVRIIDFLREKGCSANLQFMMNVMQIFLAVRLGKGAAIIPEHRLLPEMFGDIQLVPLEGLEINRYLVWSKTSTNPVLPQFIKLFQSEVETRKVTQPAVPFLPAGGIYEW